MIEMLGFVPPLSDKKKKRDKDDTEVEEEVGELLGIKRVMMCGIWGE